MHYTDVLRSDADGRFYIAATSDLHARVAAHERRRVRSTAYRRPLRLVSYEACLSPDDAYRRERYLKSGRGGRYLGQRLINWLSESRAVPTQRDYVHDPLVRARFGHGGHPRPFAESSWNGTRGDKCRPNYFFLKRRCAPGKRHLNRSEQSGRQGKLGRYKLERY